MAVSISASQKVSFSDSNMDSFGVTSFAVAITLTTTGTLTNDRRIAGQWGNGSNEQSWVVYVVDTDEIGFFIRGMNINQFDGVKTTDTPLAINTTHRIVCTFTAPNTFAIMVNGVSRTITALSGGSQPITEVQPLVSIGVFVGREDDEAIDGEPGDYSELALWALSSPLPSWVSAGYATQMSPLFWPHGLVFYAPLWSIDHLLDIKGGSPGANTSATTAIHPAMFYTAGPFAMFGLAAVGGVTEEEVEPEIGESFGPLVWVEWGGSDDVIRVWAPVDLPDPETYYHGYKAPLLLVAGRVVRALSDEQGEYQGQVFDVTVDDTARDLRTLLGASDNTRHLLNTRGVMRMISQADWRLKLTPRTVAIGQVRNYRLH